MISTTKKNLITETLVWTAIFASVCGTAYFWEEIYSFGRHQQKHLAQHVAPYIYGYNQTPVKSNSSSSDAMVVLRAGPNGHFGVRANINNVPIALMVDTGATQVALSYEDAERIGLADGLRYDHTVKTANGIGRVARVTLDSIMVDTIEVNNVSAFVLERGKLNHSLLGMSFMSRLKKIELNRGELVMIQ